MMGGGGRSPVVSGTPQSGHFQFLPAPPDGRLSRLQKVQTENRSRRLCFAGVNWPVKERSSLKAGL